ncbi:MBOAT family O-acyltransferase [Umezakia ovalisporum]|jgi:D-alanyl-lipoteichoic acid acyltransferase DltB (MBOAT superfamily)|uniref:MBOAT family O-acyltransferase n=1 Tax=Umezakia ovalisporum TaxID=75695 RepID=UPI0024733CFD|nr:MBOAT family O-acyltransferase [Umezakia ovalisporum]MDH6083758.1 MBOAT family protein [Umezakia ovalisporum TAC611]
MLFHSYEFIFAFLPITLAGFILLSNKKNQNLTLIWLVVASMLFYASWLLQHSILLIASTIFNYYIGQLFDKNRQKQRKNFFLLLFALTINLLTLCYFKYINFGIENLNVFLSNPIPNLDILIPIGISFFTFYQIIYLIDVYNNQVEKHNLLEYFFFVTFFPYITAGPIVLQKEILPQLKNIYYFNIDNLVIGLSMFSIGLFKKVVLSDGIAPYANAIFDTANGSLIGAADGWLGMIAYTLQLYFDFSGYSDMAIGLGCMFGIKLPLNFNSPVKSVSIIDFWRRWHITMTRFFTMFVYSPLAISLMRMSLRKIYNPALTFTVAIALPIIFTFTLAGLWHGAGWTFVIFGLIHGVALAVNHAWKELRLISPPPVVGWTITMGVVVVGLLFFRAENLATAWSILQGMVGINEAFISENVTKVLNLYTVLPWIVFLSTIVLFAPNTQELMRDFSVTTDSLEEDLPWPSWLAWQPNVGWALFCTILFLVAILSISERTEFLYYKF